MRIAAVVVTYNRKELLEKNIRALLQQETEETLDIIVIDNASTDGTSELIGKYKDSVHYVNTGNNLGGAGGFQYGIKYAAEYNYDYVWLMDDDCIPEITTLDAFLKVDKRLEGRYGFLSSKVLWKDKTICKMNIQRKNIWTNVNDWDNEIVKIQMASFVSLFLPMKIIREVGLPIKEFFIWTDDWEYTRRISKLYDCYLVNESIVIHYSINNNGASIHKEKKDRLDRYNYLYRNDVFLYKREGIEGVLYEIIRLILHMLRVLLLAKDNKMKRMMKIIIGTYRGLKFNPDIEKVERFKI